MSRVATQMVAMVTVIRTIALNSDGCRVLMGAARDILVCVDTDPIWLQVSGTQCGVGMEKKVVKMSCIFSCEEATL